jgi:hypothetical protein
MENKDKKVVLIIGAGATFSDGMSKPIAQRPPMDAGFFRSAKRDSGHGLSTVNQYMKDIYGFEVFDNAFDSLEQVMVRLYADINNPSTEERAYTAFRALVKLFNHRLASTTNDINTSTRSNLYRFIVDILKNDYVPNNISIVTFNQDIQIEKTLDAIQDTPAHESRGKIFSFPECYNLPLKDNISVTGPPKNVFRRDTSEDGINIFKLHGSLNWYSRHNSSSVSKNVLLSPNRNFNITKRKIISLDMRYAGGQRSQYTFPIVVPPVIYKSGIFHKHIQQLWKDVESYLLNANHVLVLGYSCPVFDIESANLIQRSIRNNNMLESFSIIDPNPKVIERYIDLTHVDSIYYYKDCKTYLRHD